MIKIKFTKSIFLPTSQEPAITTEKYGPSPVFIRQGH